MVRSPLLLWNFPLADVAKQEFLEMKAQARVSSDGQRAAWLSPLRTVLKAGGRGGCIVNDYANIVSA